MNARDANMTLADPYVQAKLKGIGHLFNSEKQQTPIVTNNANPTWNWSFLLHPTKANDTIILSVFDYDVAKKDTLIGKALIPVAEFLNRGPVELWLPLYAKKKARLQNADLHVVMDYGQNAVSIDQNRYQLYGQQTADPSTGLVGGHLPLYSGQQDFWSNYNGAAPMTGTGMGVAPMTGMAQPMPGHPGYSVVNVPTETVRENVTTHVVTTTGDRIGRDIHPTTTAPGTVGNNATVVEDQSTTKTHHGLGGLLHRNKDTNTTTNNSTTGVTAPSSTQTL